MSLVKLILLAYPDLIVPLISRGHLLLNREIVGFRRNLDDDEDDDDDELLETPEMKCSVCHAKCDFFLVSQLSEV
ncbi:hypothetical protein DAPPUDRAFT_248725 [Daphnia pulex]|uniref:Uncharacterized protein n=1 Tax=Daphnia pulex TaxID=6669 RepID=E9GV33_DAPPU|nr:hypothetical protein DAPPUDRAFT_248725 [Daphnia pulex]|eukprot:EFX76684.1 hypothetical protein DAPPUDRAFT_248725 [Daphnia pulex]